ncbi:MAG TPA: TlpA disulfide reductase family protein, partial [Sphingobacteriaceae bacterium]|nr:TlpA disulfide reductase family protein [Sphingobacteriaceae bacterium]
MNLTKINIYKIIGLLDHFLSNLNSRVYSQLSVTVFILCFSLFSYVEAWSQQGASALRPRVPALKVGDALPDDLKNIPLTVINHPEGKQTIKLVDYKNKLIIIDFWATWCLGCIPPLQKLDTIQKELADDLVIIPVTNDNRQKADEFIKGRRWKLPTVVNNSILQEYFPHKYIPHYVWVNHEGRIEAITGAEAVNRANIKAVIEGRNLDVPNKNDLLSFDFKKPLFIDGNGGDGNSIKYRSLFSEPIPGLFQTTSNVISDTINNTSRIYAINCRAMMLYSLAYQKLQSFPSGRIVYEIKDSAKRALFLSSKDGQSSKNHLFTYELITPLNSSEKVMERVADDLEHFFGLRTRFEKRLVDCYVLK